MNEKDSLQNLQKLKEAVLKDAPRMTRGSAFSFRCRPGIACFNRCCADVNIFLTPYDVLRLKNRLGVSSTTFMGRYTALPIDEKQRFPVVLLRMRDDETKRCHFVDERKGCTVYEDRPWACRMYPVGLASPREPAQAAVTEGRGAAGAEEEEFYFLMEEEGCLGHGEDRTQTVGAWLADQGIEPYDRFGRLYKELTLHDFFLKGGTLSPERMEMFYTACYDLDRFREFVFESSFLDRFRVEGAEVEAMRKDDEALLAFAFRWLRYCLFGEAVLEVKDRTPRGRMFREATRGSGGCDKEVNP